MQALAGREPRQRGAVGAISWNGSHVLAEQAASLASLLYWLCSRALPPGQLRLTLRVEEALDWVPPDAAAQTWLHLGAVLALCAPRLQQLTLVQVRWTAPAPASRAPFLRLQRCPASFELNVAPAAGQP